MREIGPFLWAAPGHARRIDCSVPPAVQGHTSLAHSIDLLFSRQDSQDGGPTRKCGCEEFWEIRLFVSRSISVDVGGILALAGRMVVAAVRRKEHIHQKPCLQPVLPIGKAESSGGALGNLCLSGRYADEPLLQFSFRCRQTQNDVDQHDQSAKGVDVRRAVFIFRQDMRTGSCCISASDGIQKKMLTDFISRQNLTKWRCAGRCVSFLKTCCYKPLRHFIT